MATVPASTRSTTYTLASDSAGPFLVGFRIFDASLAVYVDDIPSTNFTLSAVFSGGYADDASILFNEDVPSGSIVRIDGDQPIARAASYLNPDPNLTRLMNIEFGRVWAGMQQLSRDIDRLPISPAEVDFASRAALVAAVSAGVTVATGQTLRAEGIEYKGQLGATGIPDLPGLVPGPDVSADHFGGDLDALAAYVLANEGKVVRGDGTYSAPATGADRSNVIVTGDGEMTGSNQNTTNYRREVYQPNAANPGAFRDPMRINLPPGNGAVKIVLVGDSLSTYYANNIAQGESFAARLEAKLKEDNPDRQITFVSRSIGGQSYVGMDGVPAGVNNTIYPWYTNTALPWLDYVEDENPDIVILASGMNDGASFSETAFESVVSKVQAMTTVKDIWFATPMVPNLSPDPAYSAYATYGSQEGRDRCAGYIRTYASVYGYSVIDLNRTFNLVRDGRDICDSYFTDLAAVTYGSPGKYTFAAADACRNYAARCTVPSSAWSAVSPWSFTLSAEANNVVFVRNNGGFLRFQVYRTTGLLTTIDTTIPTPVSSAIVDISVIGEWVGFNIASGSDAQPYSFKVVRSGGLFQPVIGEYGGTAGLSAITPKRGHDRLYVPLATDFEIWGEPQAVASTVPVTGGNGVNHPSSKGISYIYGTHFARQNYGLPTLGALAGVQAYGAGAGGDDTAAFSAAALAAIAEDNVGSPWSAVPHALVCRVPVPAGQYTLSSLVDTGGREVTWVLDPAAIIDGVEYINGAVERAGRVTRRFGNGTLDQGTGYAVAIGGDYDDKPPGVTGVTNVQQLADYAQHDAVALVAAAYAAPAVIDVGTATYTATTATIAAPGADAVKRLRRGDIIYTKHSPKCAGILSSWNANGSVLTVTEWRRDGGSSAVTPANGTGLSIGVQKIYGINAIAMLTPTGFATQSIGQEISNRNTLGDSTADIDDPTNRVWGYLSAAAAEGTPGYYKSQAAFIARGSWFHGFFADNQDTGYSYRSSVAGGKTSFASRSHFNNTLLRATDTTDKQRYVISGHGDVTHGDPTVAAALGRYIEFATAGLGAAYDVRLTAIGGTSTNGEGALTVAAVAGVTLTGPLLVSSDGVRSIGDPAARFGNVYATRLRPGAGSVQWTSGAGSPEGVLTAVVGSLYTRSDGGAATTLYVKESGSGNTGWVAK